MAKEKTKKTTKKKKAVEVPVDQPKPVSQTPSPAPVVKEAPAKSSLLPKSISKPIEELSKRVKVLEDLVAKLLGTQQ